MKDANGRKGSSSSAGQPEMLERMILAVKNAHKAMQVLKEENEKLKAENEDLKRQLAEAEVSALERMVAEVNSSSTSVGVSSHTVLCTEPKPKRARKASEPVKSSSNTRASDAIR